jgi:hypothetical protein
MVTERLKRNKYVQFLSAETLNAMPFAFPPSVETLNAMPFAFPPSVETLNAMPFAIPPSVETLKKTNACNLQV